MAPLPDLEKQRLERGDGGRSVFGGGCNVGEAAEARRAWPGDVRQRKRKFSNLSTLYSVLALEQMELYQSKRVRM